jgi:hypothetical protein
MRTNINKYEAGQVLKMTSIGCAVALLAIGCNNSTATSSTTDTTSDSVRQDKTQVYMDTAEVSVYRRNEEDMIRKNDEKIAELKEKVREEKRAESREEYSTQLDTLTQENSRLSIRLKEIGQKSKADWESFKHDFNKDMDSVGKSISRFAERNLSKNNDQ